MASSGSDNLTVRSSRTRGLVIGVIVLLGALGLAVWQGQHPSPLPTSTRTVNASTPVDEAVYIGMADGIDGRLLHLSGVKVQTTSNTDVSVIPLLCRGGRIEATTDPEAFCSELVNPEGQDLRVGDSVVLQVLSDEPAVAVIDPVRLGFREGLQWGTFPTGAGAVVRVLSR
ncbi:MAG: hypothetical protein WB471_01410 [Nocardioides sp.]